MPSLTFAQTGTVKGTVQVTVKGTVQVTAQDNLVDPSGASIAGAKTTAVDQLKAVTIESDGPLVET